MDAVGLDVWWAMAITGAGLVFYGHAAYRRSHLLFGALSGVVAALIVAALPVRIADVPVAVVALLSAVGGGAAVMLFRPAVPIALGAFGAMLVFGASAPDAGLEALEPTLLLGAAGAACGMLFERATMVVTTAALGAGMAVTCTEDALAQSSFPTAWYTLLWIGLTGMAAWYQYAVSAPRREAEVRDGG